MSTIKADTVQPSDFASDLTLGASGDTVTVAGDSILTDKVQDKGGNTLWDFSTGDFVSTKKEFASQNLKLLSTAEATGQDSVSFTNQIDSTYDVYIFKFMNINPASDAADLSFQVSTAGSFTYASTITSTFFYAYQFEDGTGNGLNYWTTGDQAQGTAYQKLVTSTTSDADGCCAGELYLFGPSSTTYTKQFHSTMQSMFSGSGSRGAENDFTAGYINTTSAVDAIDFKMDSGKFDGTIKMYGLL